MTAPVTNVKVAEQISATPVMIKGEGAPLVYLHGLLGPEWDRLQEGLAAKRRVVAPAHVGSDEPEELRHVDGIYDLVLYYDEVFDRLGLDQVDLVGHSFGGMVAAEFAAAYPARVRKLALIDPLGLWRDDAPVEDYLMVAPDRQVSLLLGDPGRDDVKARLALPQDPEAQIQEMLHRVTVMASTAHFLWPIPERGLHKRLHRIRAETLILWGADDRLVPSVYARAFADRIARSEIAIIPNAGHTPHFDDPQAVLDRLLGFLAR
jgi:pimeloyl-ACP methyl ester carboxylesterase